MLSRERRKALEAGTDTPLPSVASAENERQWRRLTLLRNRFVGCFVGSLGCEMFFLYLLLHGPSQSPLILPIAGAMLALTACWVGGGYLALRSQSRLVTHVRQTLRSKDIHSLGFWIDQRFSVGSYACNTGEWDLCREDARTGVLEYLPLLTAETASLLRATDRHTLYRTLYGQDTELIAVVLQVVPVLGDAHALRGVQHLAAGRGAARKHPELQSEAQSILTRLQAGLAINSNPQTLLRSSQPPQAPQEDLLLPAHPSNTTDPSELLRADRNLLQRSSKSPPDVLLEDTLNVQFAFRHFPDSSRTMS